ncbi:potassium transporter Kef [Alteromonas sp. KS69]|jgi:predicted Kef-type K+ transport protein|uniref:cation:proton antiporter family protein n=2 Tax=Alteromonas TaxID=226 RepID=UPI000C116432|nr:cation:proton antiporter family protein [Alteromonas sp. KS69]PHS58985.1 MAG: potassium transporter Kef [Alteromonas sp.]RUP77272.1 potassium transporter Kef [Alteromonas sp. KS69]|tara:strand:+ start:24 stop:1598 length:1575 start_codon:yes stop_codon:yes gene_type:complete
MEYAFLLFAFVCGLTVKLIGIPPLVGYLVAGFLLNFSGYTLTDDLTKIANLGITIMLFTIGLKLNIRDLSKREVWAGSITHTLIWVGIVTCGVYGIAAVASQYIEGLTWQSATLIAFALSFSSTVCVIKVLEESGESKTRHGRLAIGILVMQDVFAVIFLVAATGKLPSVWALGLLALIPAMPLINRVINKSGHGELLPLTGFILALGGYHLFELVNIKGDLGALIFGIMLAQHEKASELAKSLLSFKDLFLIGFFLTIGLTALPDFNMIIIALVFCLFIPIKATLFFGLFTSLRLRGRTSYLSSLVLSNFSEFGLIVGALAVSLGLLAESWLVVIALSLSVSFVITSVLYRTSHSQYHKYKDTIKRFEKNRRLKEDIYPALHKAEFLVLGMGRVGQGAFNALSKLAEVSVWGMDADRVKVKQMASEGLNVICGDGEDVDLWDNLELKNVHLILLALPSIQDAINITRQLRNAGYTGKVAAIARYEDEVNHLLEQGVDKVFNFFTEAGLGFAEESLAYANTQQK